MSPRRTTSDARVDPAAPPVPAAAAAAAPSAFEPAGGTTSTGGTVSAPGWPAWAREIATLYQSNAANQFILYGNVNDRLLIPPAAAGQMPRLGSLNDFLIQTLLPRFDVVLTFDVGNGIRIEKGGAVVVQWPAFRELGPQLPHAPRLAIETLTVFLRYAANLALLGQQRLHVAIILRAAQLIVPATGGMATPDLSAMVLQVRDWSTDTLITEHTLASFLIVENLSDLHPLLANNSRAAALKVPLPTVPDLEQAVRKMSGDYGVALGEFAAHPNELAQQLAGASNAAVESLLKTRQFQKQALNDADLVELKKQLVEKDCNGLIEFIESSRTLDDLHGQEKVKEWLRQDFELWKKNDLAAMPMGYLLCGPVGTGKTYMVECLAGEAGAPVVKLKNFRDKWVGSTEGNLEKIFRLLQALGRCFVFIDEADQALGKREGGANDSGVGGRVYSMMAEEMSNTKNRGKIVWILASSRPDLIEVDLKRPGRIDVKIPLFPTSTPEESYGLLRALCKKRDLKLDDKDKEALLPQVPLMLTPGAAETLSVKAYRFARTRNLTARQAVEESLKDYRHPVPREIIEAQIVLAVREATDITFVPEAFRDRV